jgi:hypothetical protein
VNPTSISDFLGTTSFDEKALAEEPAKPAIPGQGSKVVVFIAKIKGRFRSQPFGMRALKTVGRSKTQLGNDVTFYQADKEKRQEEARGMVVQIYGIFTRLWVLRRFG